MFWNIFMHALIGLLGPAFFTLTPQGVGMAIVVVCFTQAVDLLRIKREMLQAFDTLPDKERKAAVEEFNANLKSTLAGILAKNVAMYSALVLIAAEFSRTANWI